MREFHIFKQLQVCLDFIFLPDYHFYLKGSAKFIFIPHNRKFIARSSSGEHSNYSVPQFDAKSWLKHLIYIFNVTEIHSLRSRFFDWDLREPRLKMPKECLKNLKILNLSIGFTNKISLVVELYSAFQHIKKFSLRQYSHKPLDSTLLLELRHLLSKTNQQLCLNINLPLNELLLTSCSSIDIHRTQLTDKDINVFLKHWFAGLKPELEHFRVRKDGPAFNQKTILKGIPHEFASIGRKFKLFEMDSQVGGIDIDLGQDIKATLVFNHKPGIADFSVAVHNSKYFFFE